MYTTINDAEGLFKLRMNNFASASVSVYSVSSVDDAIDLSSMFEESLMRQSGSTYTLDNEKIHTTSLFSKYADDTQWDIENIGCLKELAVTLCDLYPDAYVDNVRSQEIIVANFVAMTRGLSTYLPEELLEEFEESQPEDADFDNEDAIKIHGVALTKFSQIENVENDEEEDILSMVLSVFITFNDDYDLVINYNFNRQLTVKTHNEVATLSKKTNPDIHSSKEVSYSYMLNLLSKKLDTTVDLDEVLTTYVSVFNSNDYTRYNFIYAMNSLFVSAIIGNGSVYRSLKPMNYFVVSDVAVNMDGSVITADNHTLCEFIEEFVDDSHLAESIEGFGDGLLRVLVSFDRVYPEDQEEFYNSSLIDYTRAITDKYMGLTFKDTSKNTLREYVDAHFEALCNLVGNPNGLENRVFIDVDDTPIVEMPHLIVRNVDEIPIWVFLVAIPYILHMCNTCTDEELMELAEYEETGMENHPKFMETVYMVKELLDRKWN